MTVNELKLLLNKLDDTEGPYNIVLADYGDQIPQYIFENTELRVDFADQRLTLFVKAIPNKVDKNEEIFKGGFND